MSLSRSNVAEDTEEMYAAVREVMARVGDKWSLYVMDSLRDQPQRFNELKRGLDGISQRMLTLTLRGLERDGLVLRKVYSTRPFQVEYALTDLGRTLLESARALACWAEKHWEDIHGARTRFDAANEAQVSTGHYRNGKPW